MYIPKFSTPESADQQFVIKRKSFKEGTDYVHGGKVDPIPTNKRYGVGNRHITRPNFMAPRIKPRFTGDFDKLQALGISEAGETMGTLKPGSLGYFTQIRIPDPNDFTWIRERDRLQADLTASFTAQGFARDEIPAMVGRELEINPPLGRNQRTITRNSDSIANESRLNTAQKLREIIQEVEQGRAENNIGRLAVTAQLIQIMNDTRAINALTQLQLQGLGIALGRIGIPTQYKRLGLVPRFVDIVFYNANAGMINLLFFSKVREEPNSAGYNYDLIVKNFTANPVNGIPGIKLTSTISSLGLNGLNRQFLDLERGGRINIQQLRAFAAADGDGGFDGPNFDIQNGNR